MELHPKPMVEPVEGDISGFVFRSRVRQDVVAHVPIHIAGSGG